jgi:hypothetical protein
VSLVSILRGYACLRCLGSDCSRWQPGWIGRGSGGFLDRCARLSDDLRLGRFDEASRGVKIEKLHIVRRRQGAGGNLRKVSGAFGLIQSTEHAAAQVAGEEVVDKSVQTSLAAKMLEAGPRCLGGNKAANAQLALMLESLEPVIGLLAFDATGIAGNCLPDHRYPPRPTYMPHSIAKGAGSEEETASDSSAHFKTELVLSRFLK